MSDQTMMSEEYARVVRVERDALSAAAQVTVEWDSEIHAAFDFDYGTLGGVFATHTDGVMAVVDFEWLESSVRPGTLVGLRRAA